MQRHGAARKKHDAGRGPKLIKCGQFCHKKRLLQKTLARARDTCGCLTESGRPVADSPVSHAGIDAWFAKASWRIGEKPL